ncbi:MAG: NAD(P)H-dependent oxidoreductase [Coriobacteriales bacterium]|jgi:putative NADPH-quinone reductase
MKNVLVVSGHPDINNDSVANKAILEEFARLVPQATIEDLGALYPDAKIDVAAEQEALSKADVIVLQFPLWWYSMPWLLKKWMEDTFLHGFSHGSTGKALQGKKLVVSVTTGGPAEAYTGEGETHTLEEYLLPIKATSALTGMDFVGIVATHGVSYLSRTDEAAKKDMVKRAQEHAARLAKLVESL